MAARKVSKAQIQARKAKAEALRETIVDQVEQLGQSARWQEFLEFAAKFHAYSVNNVMLILAQCPKATRVAGFRKWQELGRQVRKGEQSIKIFGYATKKISEDDEETDEEERRRVYYPMLSVFDVSQTDPIEGAEPLPELAPRLVGDDDRGLYAATEIYLTEAGWQVIRENIAAANGYTRIDGSKVIAVDVELSPKQSAKTLLHEAAHAILHAEEGMQEYVEHRGLKEVEAESVAYIVAGAFGLDTSSYTIGYIAGWSNLDPEVIKQSAANVLKAAHQLIDELSCDLDSQTEAA